MTTEEQDLSHMFKLHHERMEQKNIAKRFSQLQLLMAQPFVHSSILDKQQYTPNALEFPRDDSIFSLFLELGEDAEADEKVIGIFDRTAKLLADQAGIQQLIDDLTPSVHAVRDTQQEGLDKYIQGATLNQNPSEYTDYIRADGMDKLFETYKDTTSGAINSLTAIRASRQLLTHI